MRTKGFGRSGFGGGFSFGNESSIFKKILIGVGAVIGVCTILYLLILTGRSESDDVCKKVGFGSADFFGDSCIVDKEYSYDNIVIVAGNTKNSPKPEITEEMQKILINSIADGGVDITIYSVSSALDRIARHNNLQIDSNAKNISNKVKNIELILEEIKEEISSAPIADGAEYLEAILKAGKQLRKNGGAIIVIGSGLSDRGLLNFADNDLFGLGSETVLKKLEEANEFYDIDTEDLDIFWFGIGQTVAPQESIGAGLNKSMLMDIYENVLNEYLDISDYVYGEDLDNSVESVNTDYTVKTTSVHNEQIYFNDSFGADSKLSFVSNTANFNHSHDEIVNTLSDIVSIANSHKTARVFVDGYVSLGKCGASPSVSLAQQRADAVKNFLQDMGVKNQIVAVGRSERLVEECINGRYDNNLAKQNRVVKISIGE